MKPVLLALAALMTLTIVMAVAPARAQEQPTVMTEEHISRIKNACPSVVATLGQIHANDAPVYVNRNQAYFSISDKLIARLNSRLALNRFDTTALVKIANEYTSALTNFRTTYKLYDDTMADLVRLNCVRQPVGFYDKVAETRKLRGDVQAAVVRLHGLIDQYQKEVEAFKDQLKPGVKND